MNPIPSRRCLRYSLRTLFVVTFSVAVLIWAAPQVGTVIYRRFLESERHARQRAILEFLQSTDVDSLQVDDVPIVSLPTEDDWSRWNAHHR